MAIAYAEAGVKKKKVIILKQEATRPLLDFALLQKIACLIIHP